MCYGRQEASSVRVTDVDTAERAMKTRKKVTAGFLCKYNPFKSSGYFMYHQF